MRLALSFLGPFQASLDPLPLKGFESDKVRALLAYLVVEAEQPQPRSSLASLLWPEQPQDVALKNLRHVLYKLRQVLGDAESDENSYLLVNTQTAQFNPAADFALDMIEFSGLVEACRSHKHRRLDACGSCHLRLERATELYRGEFLAGFSLPDSVEFEEWMLLQREDLHQQATYTLIHLAAYLEAHGDYAKAAGYARRQIQLEPWNEEAHRHLMRLLWFTKQRTAALAQYQACRRILSEELGIEPSTQTDDLYRRIKASSTGGPDVQAEGEGARSRHNLPVQMTPFVGRDQERARIAERLESLDRRLLTLVGPGGSGKSRLALNAAADQLGAFEDGVYYVPVASVEASNLIVSAIAQALTLTFSGKEDEESQLLRYLADKEMLLVIDNFEHLLKGTGILLKIIERAPRLSLLVTSRERLNSQAGSVMDVGGLPYPPPVPGEDLHAISPEEAGQYEAVRLFLERAWAKQEDFSLTEATTPAVVQICRIVGGLPLAIELAAVHVGNFTCAEIAEAIQANIDFLATDQRDVRATHSSIRAVFNYSWALLTEEEKAVFRKVSVFRGGWDNEAAERVGGASRTLLGSLASKSLIRRSTSTEGATIRNDIHEVLRQYADEQLYNMASEKGATLQRHAEYYLALAEEAEPNLRGANQELWLGRLDREHANLQAAIRWAVESGHLEMGLRLGGALLPFWVMHAHYATGRALLSSFDLQRAEHTPAWANALFGAGRLALQQGDHDSAYQYLEQSLTLYRELGDEVAVRKVMIDQARAYLRHGNYPRAEELASEALRIARAARDVQVMTSALTHLGHIAANHNDYARAHELYTECLQLYRSMKDKWGISWMLTSLGNLTHSEGGDTESARRLVEESLVIRRELGDKWGIAASLTSLGNFAAEAGEYIESREYITQGLALRREIGDSWAISESLIYFGFLEYSEGNFRQAISRWEQGLAQTYAQQNYFFMSYCLTGLASATLKTGNTEQAVTLAGTVSMLLTTLNVHLSRAFQRLYDEVVSVGRAELGDARWSLAWATGTTMSLDSMYAIEAIP